MTTYIDNLQLVERRHRLLLDVIKDEFERVGMRELNLVQGLLFFNIGTQEVMAGELKSRGCYQGSNVSYNLKKLVDAGYMHHERSQVDHRSVRVRLMQKGRDVQTAVSRLSAAHAQGLMELHVLDQLMIEDITSSLRRVERYWTEQFRYIY